MGENAKWNHPPQRKTRRDTSWETRSKTSWETSWETMGGNGRQRETKGDKTSGKRTHRLAQAHMRGENARQWEAMGNNEKQGETRSRVSGRRTHHPRQRHHPTQAHMWKETQVETRRETRGDKGRQRKTRRREGGHTTAQHRNICADNGRQREKTSGRRTHHPTKGSKKGYKV